MMNSETVCNLIFVVRAKVDCLWIAWRRRSIIGSRVAKTKKICSIDKTLLDKRIHFLEVSLKSGFAGNAASKTNSIGAWLLILFP